MKSTQNFPAFYYPSTVLILDDDIGFLNTFSTWLKAKSKRIKISSQPNLALNALKQQNYTRLQSMGFQREYIDEESDLDIQSIIKLNVQALLEMPNNVDERDCISTIIVDYDMPDMTGIEFFQSIKTVPVKKIMLTGHSDHKLAVDAFNQGLIDKFIIKDTTTIFDEVVLAIDECQQEFFKLMSSELVSAIGAKKESAINNTYFTKAFSNTLRKLNTVEFYLLDMFGSYLIIDSHGKKHYFIVRPDNIFDDYVDIARNNEAPLELVRDIELRKTLPILLNNEMDKLPVSTWENHSAPMQPIDMDEKFYMTVL